MSKTKRKKFDDTKFAHDTDRNTREILCKDHPAEGRCAKVNRRDNKAKRLN